MIAREKLLFFVGNKFCRAVWSRGGQFFDECEFPNDEAGRKKFAAILAGRKKTPAALLVDLVEEDYRHEMVPHLGGSDRKHYFAKKLEHYFHHTPFRHALWQYRDRQKDSALFSALTAPEKILPWLALLKTAEMPVKGVYSVAVLSTKLVENSPVPHLLLLSFEKHGGLRQSFFLRDHLMFSRLTPLSITDDLVESVITETSRMYKYLHTQNLIPNEEALTTGILCNRREREKLQARLQNSPAARYLYFDLNEVAKKIGYRPEISNSDACALFFHLLDRKNFPDQYGGKAHIREYTLWRWRQTAFGLSLASFFVALVWGAFNIAGGSAHDRKAASLLRQTDEVLREYRGIPHTLVSPDSMKTAVLAVEKLSRASPPPSKFLADLSHALAPFPSVRVNHLSWQPAASPEAIRNESGNDAASPVELRILSASEPSEVIFIGGEIFPFDGNFRNAIDTVDRFASELKKNGQQVSVLKLPIDLNPGSSLSGRGVDSPNVPATFLLKAVWKEKP